MLIMAQMSSSEIVCNILKCLFVFYGIYYVICSVCAGAFSVRPFSGKMPFDFVQWIDLSKCCMAYESKEIANLISMEVTFFLSTGAYIFLVPKRLWDYAITVTAIHILLSFLVMLSLPTNWSWWLCVGFGSVFMTFVGETTLYGFRLLKKRREIRPLQDVPAEIT